MVVYEFVAFSCPVVDSSEGHWRVSTNRMTRVVSNFDSEHSFVYLDSRTDIPVKSNEEKSQEGPKRTRLLQPQCDTGIHVPHKTTSPLVSLSPSYLLVASALWIHKKNQRTSRHDQL